ncbi:MAG: 5,10-methylenetetrahydrofolate reductase [Thiotrichales bacterium]|nr:5,10-methylenetetrahydrofolate reductase [Thiotrichales bacterium]
MVTSELNPPKGTNLEPMFERAESLKHCVDAFNVTDSHAAKMSICPLATSHLLMDRGIEPIMQMTSRDRNRIALQGDLLGAAALGIPNIVFMGGDPPKIGDHPEATGVFDLMSNDVLAAANGLRAGADLHDNELNGSPDYFLGAVVNPGASDLDAEISKMNAKIDAGAQFLQSQAIYDPASFENFMNRVSGMNVSILAGIILLKSAKMARYMTDNVPGIDVPDALIAEMEDAEDKGKTSVEIAARIINQIKPMCQGIHIMPLGWEDKIPALLEAVEAG